MPPAPQRLIAHIPGQVSSNNNSQTFPCRFRAPLTSTTKCRILFQRPSLLPAHSKKTIAFSSQTTHLLEKSLQNSWASSTISNYSNAVAQFLHFCDREKVQEDLRFPADEFVLCAFAGSSAGSLAGSSARNLPAGLKAWHHFHGVEWKGGMRLHLVLNGVKNLTPLSSKRPPRPPIDSAMLSSLIENLDLISPFDAAVAACAATAFWGQCRLGELLPRSISDSSPKNQPSRSHLRDPTAYNSPATLFLPRTKIKRHGENIVLLHQSGIINPLHLLQTHLRVNKLAGPSPLFSYRTSAGVCPLTRDRFLNCCNSIWGRIGYPRTTGHSFRIGGTTELLLAGVPPDVVKTMGRWASDAFLRYWRRIEVIAPLYAENITPRSLKRKRRGN